MQKHKYNIFPDANKEDFELLVDDIRKNGYDLDFPIIIYQGAILDGWNRWRACQQVGETPTTKEFTGSDADAINYTLRTNKRRNLTSSQWAAIAVDAEEILTEIADVRQRQKTTWINNARSKSQKDKGDCVICGQYAGWTHSHHVIPLSEQFDFGMELDNTVINLCPTHHDIVHCLLSQYKQTAFDINTPQDKRFEEISPAEMQEIIKICIPYYRLARKFYGGTI